jgi:TrmH family RNA methyltransferase
LFNELSPVQTPVGVLARFSIPAASRQEQPAFYAILEDIQDPGNMGTILRSAAAAGVDTAYLSPACTDAWSPKVLRSGMGAHFLLNIVEQCDLPAVLPSLPGKCIATQPDAEELLYSVDMTGNIGIAIGNEGSGLSAEILKACHHKVSIPMPGNMESLNAAAAATICFFERVRQLNHATPL